MYRIFRTALILLSLVSWEVAGAQTAQVRPRITQTVDSSQLKLLRGNTHPLARPEFDQGVAPVDLPMDRMLLVLSRSAQQETALENLLAAQQDPSSPQYHQWLTPQQFGQQFGVADQDIQTVTAWLESQGFQVNRVSNGKTVIEFSGIASQVQQAFHTEIHKYVVNGEEHWANASDPSIPVALAPVVAGVATLHNFYKKPQLIRSNQEIAFTQEPGSKPQYTISSGTYALAPADFATIYNINPLYQGGINGSGTTIAVVSQSNILVSDITSFRSAFGLPTNSPNVILNGRNPGRISGDDEEATLDTSWAGAVAPNATVDLVVSASTNSTSGVDLSELYIIDNNLADVMSESYGDCEADGYSQSDANYYSSLAQQAAAEGITYAVAAGDSGAEGCDDPNSELTARGPVSVNILASTPYTVAVGGTEFNENGNYSLYWNSANDSAMSSAISYIPEDVWNESCTVAQCGSSNAGIWAAGGGVSTFFSKPSWQTGVSGIPSDGARDVPDVSFTAAGHDFYLLCFDNSCTVTRRGGSSFSGVSGTSAPTPSFAGIMALVVQKTGTRQGQADPVLYSLAAHESLGSCNASNTSGQPAGNCIFNDVTVGNNAVPGESGYGTSSADYQAGVGYDLASGLGSVNVANLVNGWNGTPSFSPRFHMFIDQPGSGESTFMGLSLFSGWAVNDDAAISSVQIAIDGVPYGSATYGVTRADVCAVYPGRTGCPNVGWSIQVDTTQLDDGVHALDVKATSAAGTNSTISSSFTVANWSTADPMRVYIDTPNAGNSPFSGTVGFAGWAVNDTGTIASVAISVDGVSMGNATYGGYRPDVCVVYPGRAGCPNVGWNFTLNTTALADGTHTLAVSGFSASGQNTTVTSSFTTSNSLQNRVLLYIDNPGSQSGTFSGAASFAGWAIAQTAGAPVGIASVSVSVDGYSYGNAVYGTSRPDVCVVYPGQVGCPNVGWSFVLDTTALANGTHMLTITAASATGQQGTKSVSFTVANTTPANPMKIGIDSPDAQNSIVTGLASWNGWAIDANGAITNVAIAIDGVAKGNAAYGSSRTDVCAAYPTSAGCPYVGWTYQVDTTLIPDGTHELEVTGTSTAGDHFTAISTFTVANWTSGNPMRITIDVPNSQTGGLNGTVTLAGWAIDDLSAIANVAISIDGVSFGNAIYGISRGDVCVVYPGRAGCPNVGWNLSLDTTLLANGTHTLAVTGTSTGGQRSTVNTTFTVMNATNNPIYMYIDQPTSGATLTGTAVLSGWAIDRASNVAITSVQVLVDGVYLGNASYGVIRSDVCAVYPGEAGCPDVGWNFNLDSTLLANGKHTLEIRAIAATGQQETLSVPVNVFNEQ